MDICCHSDLRTCEFGIAVAGDWCELGLASCLMQELIRSARARGLKGMEGFILTANTPVRNLAKRPGSTNGDRNFN